MLRLTLAILLGWAVLLLCGFVLLPRLLIWIAPLLPPALAPTIVLGLQCAELALSGWVAARFEQHRPLACALLLAATLCFRDFTETLGINVPWLLHSTINTFHDARYFEGWLSLLTLQALLFGCLFAGAMLARRRPAPLSLA